MFGVRCSMLEVRFLFNCLSDPHRKKLSSIGQLSKFKTTKNVKMCGLTPFSSALDSQPSIY